MMLRRRVLYIRHRRTIEISDAFRLNQDEWFEAMSMLADVTLQDSDFDLDAVCDRIKPDFILYESPFFFPAELKIDNPHAHPQIPRMAFLIQDPYCSIRVPFLRTLERLNIRWVFTHMTETLLNQSPELKDRVFSLSFLFDERVFRDYGEPKDIPVSVFGGFLLPEIYDWRAETARTITDHFPTLIYTHPGYRKPTPRHKFPVAGEAYARLLSRSHFSIADCTPFDCLVRKHLEIPASGAVLIAPDAPVLKPYGFRDMENCILGRGDELFDKMKKVADDPALYEKIRRSGHEMVHATYARANWRGLLDFYECVKDLKPGETMRQNGILGGFEKLPAASAPKTAIIGTYPDNAMSTLFKKWLADILNKDGPPPTPPDAPMPGWLHFMVEPFILTGIRVLLQGDPAQARTLFKATQSFRVSECGLPDYDPEEIAWLSLVASLLGDSELLTITRREMPNMKHLSLRRMQWLGKVLASGGDASNPPADILRRAPDDQPSIHWTGQLEIDQWLSLIGRVLAANGQEGLLRLAPA